MHDRVDLLCRLGAAWLLLTAAWIAQASELNGSVAHTEQVRLTLTAEQSAATPGTTVWLALTFDLNPGWHVYWRNPGDSGEAPRVGWQLPDGWEAGDIRWPVPDRIPVGPLVNYGYEGTVTLLVPLTVPDEPAATTASIGADVIWLVCKEECIPQDARLSISLPVADHGVTPPTDGRFESVRARWPVSLPGSVRYGTSDAGLTLRVSGSGLDFSQADAIWFAANDWGPVAPSGEQRWQVRDGELLLTMPAGEAPIEGTRLDGLLVVTDSTSDAPVTRGFEVAAIAGEAGVHNPSATLAAPQSNSVPQGVDTTLILAIGLALLGGLLLNLMPCVLPVLSIKALALVQHAGGQPHQGLRHGVAFAAGVLLTFLALAGLLTALRAGGAAVGWGFQLQEPAVVLALMILMLVLGLNLSGVFTFGGNLAGVGQAMTEKAGLRGTFATGVLAVVVASPCTAPFMGTALGFALTRPAIETLLVFAGLAVGFALPMTLLSVFPGWARRLPSPGPWMERLRNALAFPLYATAAWLLWILTQQVDEARLAAAFAGSVTIAFGLWWLGQPLRRPRVRRLTATFLLVAGIGLLALAVQTERTALATKAPERWSAAQVEASRIEGRPVLVNFTAAWCITCKVNERVALDTAAVRKALDRHRIAYLKGDWTQRDAAITRELERFGRSGVPLYLLYPAGPGEPEVLPQLLTEGLVLQAIERNVNPSERGV